MKSHEVYLADFIDASNFVTFQLFILSLNKNTNFASY